MAGINEDHRGRIMAAMRSKNTAPELTLRRALRQQGLTGYRCHVKQLPGCPDIVFSKCAVAVFVDGAFWHGHPDHLRPNASEYWKKKIARNLERDRDADDRLQALGWTVLRFWDFEVGERLDKCVSIIASRLVQSDQFSSATD